MEDKLAFKIDKEVNPTMPAIVPVLMREMYERVQEISRELDLKLFYVKREWGQLSEGSSVAFYRPDYDRFIKEAERLIDQDKYFLQHYQSDEFWTGPQARLRVHGTLMEDPVHADLAVHQGVYINIYPLDAFPKFGFAQQNLLKQYIKLQSELSETDMTDSQNWSKRLQKRNKLMTATKWKPSEWFIIYPMVADSVKNCIINANELIFTGIVTIPTQGNYDDWLFDIADDIQ